MERLKATSLFKENEKLLKKMKEDFLACPQAVRYVKSLKIPEEVVDANIVKINDFVSDINYCKKCPGYEKCAKEPKRLCTNIVYQNGIVDYQLVPCKEYLKYITFKTQFAVRDFPEEWLNCSLKNVDPNAQRAKVIKKYLSNKENNTKDWIWITGEEGTGRTFLAANIAVDMAKNNLGPIAFINASARFKELLNKKDSSFNELIEKYCTIPVLIIDDLGNEYKSDFVRESILFPLINERSKAHLFTIITSDFTLNDVAVMYTINAASKPKIEQIKRIIKKNIDEEINIGNMSIY